MSRLMENRKPASRKEDTTYQQTVSQVNVWLLSRLNSRFNRGTTRMKMDSWVKMKKWINKMS
jgi:hypothetical protein